MIDYKRCGVVILAVLMASMSYGVTVRDFENRTFTGSTGDTLRYRLFVPKDYDPSHKYPIVSVELTRTTVQLLKDAGANPRYTEYPNVKHNCWEKAYVTRELPGWLFSQLLSKRKGR